MKRIVIAVFAAMSLVACSTSKTDSPEAIAKKQQKEQEEMARFEALKSAIENASFVMEANTLIGKRGQTAFVSETVNFIRVSGDNGAAQIAPISAPWLGQNGLGGITVEGPLRNYKYTFNEKKRSVRTTFRIHGTRGTVEVSMNMYQNGTADAMVQSATWPSRMNFRGNVVLPDNARIFEGSGI